MSVINFDYQTEVKTKQGPKDVFATKKAVIIYNADGTIYGEARVKRESDFNFKALLKIALERSGSKIEIA
ncbi:MAG: hypothetical protein GX220_02070 [Treponema sp.]|nr:hypothetical protein [Treponema sp.]